MTNKNNGIQIMPLTADRFYDSQSNVRAFDKSMKNDHTYYDNYVLIHRRKWNSHDLKYLKTISANNSILKQGKSRRKSK